MEQENKITIEEASVNLSFVKKELLEEYEFEENQYKVASTYENIFGKTSEEQRNNLHSLIGFLDDDIIMETETGTIKLEDVKEENENVTQRNMEEFHFEIIRCCYCKVWLEKDEHLKSHMLHCFKNYNRLCPNRNLRDFPPRNTEEEEEEEEKDEITTPIDVDASYSTRPTEIIDSNNCFSRADFNVHKEDDLHHENNGTIHSNTNEKTHKCSECSFQTNYKSNLKIHLDTHTGIKHFQCDICKRRFGQKGQLKLHIKDKHSNTNEKEYKCSECSYQTNRKGDLNIHLGTHTGIKEFECDICKQRFGQNSYLKRHIKNKHSNTNEKKQYKCSQCSFQTNHRSSLKRHLGTHTGIKEFECDICKQRFGRKSNLRMHIKSKHSNTNEKEYKCSECSYQTNHKPSLKVHLGTHTGVKDFQCDICKRRFSHKISLKVHIKDKHSNTNEKDYKCSECSYQTNLKGNLKLHIKNKHSNSNEKEYKCSECSYQTNHKGHLKIHLGTHTGVKNFECDICKWRFGRKDHLRTHIKNQHSNTNEKE